jgi:hypothetical protein
MSLEVAELAFDEGRLREVKIAGRTTPALPFTITRTILTSGSVSQIHFASEVCVWCRKAIEVHRRSG